MPLSSINNNPIFFTLVAIIAIVSVSLLAVGIVLLSNFPLNTFTRVYSPNVTNDALLRVELDGTHYYRVCNGSTKWSCVTCGTIQPSREQSVTEGESSNNNKNDTSSMEHGNDAEVRHHHHDRRRSANFQTSSFTPRDNSEGGPSSCSCIEFDWRNCPIQANFSQNCPALSHRVELLAESNLGCGIVCILTFVFGFAIAVYIVKGSPDEGGKGIDSTNKEATTTSIAWLLAPSPFVGASLATLILSFVRLKNILNCSDCCNGMTSGEQQQKDPIPGVSLEDQGFTFTGAVRNSYFVGMAFCGLYFLSVIIFIIQSFCCSSAEKNDEASRQKERRSHEKHQYLSSRK